MSIKSVKQIPHRTYNAGEIIYSVDEQSRNVFLIHSGQVAIETRLGLNVGILNEGEIFGEVGHITAKARTVTARAKTKCIVKVIDEDTLKAKMQGADPICQQSSAACPCGSAMPMPRPSNIGKSSASIKHWKLTHPRISLNRVGQLQP